MVKMEFTYRAYLSYLERLRDAGYLLANFQTARAIDGSRAIVRHDIDVSPKRALIMAEFEYRIQCRATYFVLLSSSFYNLLDAENEKSILRIASLGHEIGLHFDTTKYGKTNDEELEKAVLREIDLLSAIVGEPIKSISWHIPRNDLIGVHLDFLTCRDIQNAYDPEYFTGYKYCSDSMMRWRDPLLNYIDCKNYPKLQVLTHPIWYGHEETGTSIDILREFFFTKQNEHAEYLTQVCPEFSPCFEG